MKKHAFQWLSAWLALALLLSGCGLGSQLLSKKLVVGVVYGS